MRLHASKTFAALATAALMLPVVAAPGAYASHQAAHPHAGVTLLWFMRINDQEDPWERAEVAGFQKLNPNININLVLAPNPNGGFDTKFNQLHQAGTTPDIWSHLGQDGFADYYHRNLLLNLSPLIKSSGYSFGTTPMNLVNTYAKPDGGIYGIPSITLGSYLYYNKDIFDAYNKAHPSAKIAYPPINWDDKSWTFAKMVSEAKLLTGMTIKTSSGSTKSYGFVENQFPYMPLAWQAGSEMFNQPGAYASGTPSKINLADPKIVKHIQDVADLFNVSKVSPPYSKVQGISNTGAEPFQFGDIAMEVTGGWGFRSFKNVKFHWGAAAIPGAPSNKDTLFTDPYMVYKGTKHAAEAMQFIKYLTNKDSMLAYVKAVGFTPSNPDFLGTWYSQYAALTGQSVADLTTLVAGARKYGQESPNHLIVNFSAIHNYMKPNCIEPIFFGHKTAATALAACEAPVNAILQQNTGG